MSLASFRRRPAPSSEASLFHPVARPEPGGFILLNSAKPGSMTLRKLVMPLSLVAAWPCKSGGGICLQKSPLRGGISLQTGTVTVVPDASIERRLSVVSPSGFRVEELTFAEAAALLKALG